jgi:hypothetical protein
MAEAKTRSKKLRIFWYGRYLILLRTYGAAGLGEFGAIAAASRIPVLG